MVSRVEIIVFIIRDSFFELSGEKEKSSEILSDGYATRHNCFLVGTLAQSEYLNDYCIKSVSNPALLSLLCAATASSSISYSPEITL